MPGSTLSKAKQLDDLLGSKTVVVALLEEVNSAFTFTADHTSDTLTTTTSDLVNGVRVNLTNFGGALPTGLSGATEYRVVQVSGSPGGAQTCKLALEANFSLLAGTATATVAFSDNGTGTHSLVEKAFDKTKDNLATLIRHEVADYEGSGRQTTTMAASSTLSGTTASIASHVFTFAPTTGPIAHRYAVVIRDGNTTIGNTTGVFLDLLDVGATQTIPSGSTYDVTFAPTL